MVSGAGGGIASALAGRYNPKFGPGAGMAVAGLLSGNDALETLAGMSLAQAVVSGIAAGANAGGSPGGWY